MSNPWEQPPVATPAAERQTVAELLRARLEKLGVDEKIQDTVIELNRLGFVTTESCEGHLEHGNIAPRVRFEAPGRPEWRFVGEREAFESAAQANGITIEDIRENLRPKYGETITHDETAEERIFQTLQQARTATPHETETEAFTRWREATNVLAARLKTWLTEHERSISDSDEEKLHIDVDDDPRSGRYAYFLHAGGSDYLDMIDPEELLQLPEVEKLKRRKQHAAYQKATKAFTDFLQRKV